MGVPTGPASPNAAVKPPEDGVFGLPKGFAALRAHDIHQGLQAAGVDRGSGVVGHHLEVTQRVGMAGALATAIKGMDVIENGADLKVVAEQQLDIPTLAFESVVRILEETGYVRNVHRGTGGRILKLFESVPSDFTRLYGTLDDVYEGQSPGEVEISLVAAVNRLSQGPAMIDELDIDRDARDMVLNVAGHAEAIRRVALPDRDIVYSPYFAYERPEQVAEVLQTADLEQVQAAFRAVRKTQGLPVTGDSETQMVSMLISAGLMAGPGVEDPGGTVRLFGIAPYGVGSDLLTIGKPILEKANAIVAAMRMGQRWGGASRIAYPELILQSLLEGRRVARHSSTRRQYSVLSQMGVVHFDRDSGWAAIQLIDTPDNKLAVRIAMDLIKFGEAMRAKEPGAQSFLLPDPDGRYRSPIQTVKRARHSAQMPKKLLGDLWTAAMGFKPSV